MAKVVSIDVERFVNGDEKVFKSLFDQSYIEMVQRAVYYTNDFAVAEDVVQEVFMRLWERREELRGVQNIRGYLFYSIRNKCLNFIEHQQVMDKYRQFCLLQEVQNDEEEPEVVIEKLERLLEKLPEKRKKVLEMSILDSKSYAEIASSLDISLNTVKDHIKKAYAFLREEMHKDISTSILFFAFYFRQMFDMRKNS